MARKPTSKARSAPKAPAASARSSRQKPLSDLSPAYRKRIEREERRAAAEGRAPNRQAGRGHKPQEHVARRERELASGGLTTYQRGAVDKFAREQAAANRLVGDPDQMADNLLRVVRARGYDDWFAAVRAKRNSFRKLTRERTRKTYRDEEGRKFKLEVGGQSKNVAKMEEAADYFDMPDIPDDDERWHWFYYH